MNAFSFFFLCGDSDICRDKRGVAHFKSIIAGSCIHLQKNSYETGLTKHAPLAPSQAHIL